ncbi:MAG: acetylxylan esterase [Verrucomicrobiota bacterium]|nr:hypothetical protein [Limisphaera sp.]MDW8381919.1 acetylxylan esterase [Verrucomicrobiota bacterium]
MPVKRQSIRSGFTWSWLALAGLMLCARGARPHASGAEILNPGPVQWSAEEDHRRMQELLGIRRLRPGPVPQPGRTNSANYEEARANLFSDLPDPLRMKDGRRVTTAEMWWRERRPEIVEDFEREIYGRIPRQVPVVRWEVHTQVVDRVVAGIPVRATRLVGRVDSSICPMIEVNLRLTVVTPLRAEARVPVLIMFGAFGWDGFPRRPDEPPLTNRWAGLGGGPFRDPPSTEQLITAGWGYAVLDPTSVQADDGAGLTRGIIGLVNCGRPRHPEDWGTLRAWAWGVARVMDYLETDPCVDARKVGVEGVSRFGKAALVAMAFEPRLAVGLIGSSGAGGASLLRRNFGETVENLVSPGAYHWFAGGFLKYAAEDAVFGRRDASDLPVDAHQLIALCAPRPVFLSYGVPEKGDALWLDQRGSFMAAVAAGPVYRLLGARDLGVTENYRTAPMPPVNAGLLEGHLAWRQHDGGHETRSNMKHFLAWAERWGIKGAKRSQLDATTVPPSSIQK